jgi:hypothetical protein
MPTGTTAGAPQVLLGHHLKQLKLPTILREYDKVATQCARDGVDHRRYLLRLVELELIDRERRMVERRIRQASFPATKSLGTFEFTAPYSGQHPQPFPNGIVIGSRAAVAHRRSINSDQRTRPTLAHLEALAKDKPRLLAWMRALEYFRAEILQHSVVQRWLGQQLPEPGAADTMLLAHIGSRHPDLLLHDHADNLLLAEPRSLHRLSPSVGTLLILKEI